MNIVQEHIGESISNGVKNYSLEIGTHFSDAALRKALEQLGVHMDARVYYDLFKNGAFMVARHWKQRWDHGNETKKMIDTVSISGIELGLTEQCTDEIICAQAEHWDCIPNPLEVGAQFPLQHLIHPGDELVVPSDYIDEDGQRVLIRIKNHMGVVTMEAISDNTLLWPPETCFLFSYTTP